MGDLELQRLKAVADAARAMRMAASITSYYGIEADHSDSGYIVNIPVLTWKALVNALNVLDRGREMPEMEYDNGPWASTESGSRMDAAGYWHFPGPDISDKGVTCNPIIFGPTRPETKPPIRIVPLKQGFLVQLEGVEGYVGDDLAFTDALDVAEWLLGWLGFEDEIVESVYDILAGLWDADELVGRAVSWNDSGHRRPPEYERAVDVAGTAWALVKNDHSYDPGEYAILYNKLVKAVKRWRDSRGERGCGWSQGSPD